MDGSELIRQFVEYLKSRWYRISTLLILLLALSFSLLLVFSGIDISEVEQNEYLLGGGVLLLAIMIWVYSNHIPKAPKGKIGFAVGILTDDPIQQQKIKRDFIETLRNLLYKSRFKYSFVFIELPSHFTEKIDTPDKAIEKLHDIRCAFMVYGKARTTTNKGQTQHVLDLGGVVAHKPIPVEISRSLAREFGDLFPKRKIISAEGDLFEFEITARWIDLVSKYVIAIAALLSGDVGYAQELCESLEHDLKEEQTNLPALIKIKHRLPARLTEIYLIQVRICYEEWKRTKDKQVMSKMKAFIDRLFVVSPDNIDGRIFSSMWHFVVARDVTKAKNEIIKAKNNNNAVWKYNHAFLLAYEGDLNRAQKEYKTAFAGYIPEPSFPLEIIEFIMWVIDVEANKTQLYFCLGLIYYYSIGDYALALQSFEKFIALVKPGTFSSQVADAEKLIAKIQKDIRAGKAIFVDET